MGILAPQQVEKRMVSEAQASRAKLINEAGRIFESTYADMPSFKNDLGAKFESADKRTQLIAANTMMAVESTRSMLEGARQQYGESVVQASLGSLNPRVLDVVRVFYPSMIAQDIADIQPLTGEFGQVFVIKPQYAGPVAGVPGVTTGSQMFLPNTYATNNNYASEYSFQTVGSGTGSATAFAATLAPAPIRPTSVVVSYTISSVTYTGIDDGNGNIVNAGTGTAISAGTINYTTGALSLTFGTAPSNSTSVTAQWRFNSETGQMSIRSVDFSLQLVPVQAKLFPLTFSYSVAAGLAASAHLAVDVQDVLVNEAATLIKVERDNRLISLIANSAAHSSTLDFDATMTSVNYDKRSKFGEIEIKLDVAQNVIQTAVGRGGVDWIICDPNSAVVFENCRSFKAEPVRAPIGSYKIGTLRDGTVSVIKCTSGAIPANTFIFGFKGYTAGDASVILAEWIPLYATPLFQNPTFSNQQGLCSLYDMFVNNSSYFAYGNLSNFVG